MSPFSRSYNCIAWAASVTRVRWEPDPFQQYYWPDQVPRDYTVEAFIAAYQTIGFDVCSSDLLEPGIEKIAIYTLNNMPEHAARQLPNGSWTSKMGDFEDIQHRNLNDVSGPFYGHPTVYMSRKLEKDLL